MQVIIRVPLKKTLTLPINYNHILQGIVYDALSDDEDVVKKIHDDGLRLGPRVFRPLTFSALSGEYKISGSRITFLKSVEWEIRSVDDSVIKTISSHLVKCGIRFGDNTIDTLGVNIMDKSIVQEECVIKMVTPICAYSSDRETKKSYYYTPEQVGFYEITKNNAIKKYEAHFGKSYEGDLLFEPQSVKERDKVITRYDGIIIEAWKGEYRLSGSIEMFNFLYNVGLGAKNGQGFGMFNVISEGIQ